MPENASLAFSPEVRQQLLEALSPVSEKIQKFLDAGDELGLADFAVRGAFGTYKCAKRGGLTEEPEVVALASLLKTANAIYRGDQSMRTDEFGQLAAQAFRHGGEVHALLRRRQPTG